MNRMKLLDFIVSFLGGMVVGIIFAGVMVSPQFHKPNCDDGKSVQIEDGVEKHTYAPALDTCKDNK